MNISFACRLPLLSFLTIFLFTSGAVYAQEVDNEQNSVASSFYRIKTSDGNVYHGQILRQEDYSIRFKTSSTGEIILDMDDIKSIKRLSKDVTSQQLVENNHLRSSKYFFAPSGFGIRRGEAYYQNTMGFLNQIAFGLTDHFSIEASILPIFLLGGDVFPFWITPTFSIPTKNKNIHFGGGILWGASIGQGFSSSEFGLFFANTTIGSKSKNVSIGLGYGYDERGPARRPSLNISGMFPVGKRTFLISENYLIISDDFVLISVGARTLFKRLSLDYGIISPPTADRFIAIPWLGLVLPLGNKN